MAHSIPCRARAPAPGSGHRHRPGDVGEPHHRLAVAALHRGDEPFGHRGSGERADRSTTTSASGSSHDRRRAHPARRRARPQPRRTAGRAAPGRSRSVGAGGVARTRSTGSARTLTPASTSASDATLRRMAAAAGRACSTRTTADAPRLAASSPSAPDPAYRSSTRAPRSTSRCSSGRTAPRGRGRWWGGCPAPGGAWIRRPPASPEMIPGRISRAPGGRPAPRRALDATARAAPGALPARVVVHEREGVLAGLHDQVLVAQQAQQPQLGAAAALAGAEHVALAALLEVEAGEGEPVGRRGDGLQALRRADPARRSVISRQRPGASPRPTRPRSWCSWETPNRSASMTTMTVAFGTSTPTSITVVATRTSISPAAKARITASLSSAGSRPCSTSTRSPARAGSRGGLDDAQHAAQLRADRRPPRSRPRPQPLRRRSGRRAPVRRSTSSSGAVVVVADARADDVRLVSGAPPRRPAATCARIQLGLSTGHDVRGDRRPPGGQLAQGGGLQVAEHGHRDGARDRRGRHDQHVRRLAPLARSASRCSTPNRCCSSTTTSPRSANWHVLLEQRVRADDDAGLAAWPRPAGPCGVGRGLAAGQQRHPGAHVGAAEHARPRRGRRASCVIDRRCCAASTSVGASSAACPPESTTVSIARSATMVLPEPTSPCSSRCIGCARGQVGGDLLADRALPGGQRERQPLRRRPPAARLGADGEPWCGTPPSRAAAGQERLQDERLLVAQPGSRAPDVVAVRWAGAPAGGLEQGNEPALRRTAAGTGSSTSSSVVEHDPHRTW